MNTLYDRHLAILRQARRQNLSHAVPNRCEGPLSWSGDTAKSQWSSRACSHWREDYTWHELLVTSKVAYRRAAEWLSSTAVNGWWSDLTYISADKGVTIQPLSFSANAFISQTFILPQVLLSSIYPSVYAVTLVPINVPLGFGVYEQASGGMFRTPRLTRAFPHCKTDLMGAWFSKEKMKRIRFDR